MVGAGVLVQSGVIYSFATGPVFSALTGGSIFVGAGSSTNVGVLNVFSATTNSHHGEGTIGTCNFKLYCVHTCPSSPPNTTNKSVYDVGDSTWIGCPIATAIACAAFYGLGGVFSHPGQSVLL